MNIAQSFEKLRYTGYISNHLGLAERKTYYRMDKIWMKLGQRIYAKALDETRLDFILGINVVVNFGINTVESQRQSRRKIFREI